MSRKIRCMAGCMLAVLCNSQPARTQTFAGTITGRVLDSQQAVIPNTSVTLRSSEMALERRTFSNAQGEYTFELVPPGRFELLAEHAEFAPTVLKVEVVVATPLRVDVILRVRPIQQELKVVGEGGIAVQTENASLAGSSLRTR